MGLFNRRKPAGADDAGNDSPPGKRGIMGKAKDAAEAAANAGHKKVADGFMKVADTASDAATGAAAMTKGAAMGVVNVALKKVVDEISDEEVAARTSPELWFTPAAGWPDAWESVDPGKDPTPTLLMPTAKETPFLFSNSKRLKPLGELRVEVLQAEGLKGSDLLSLPDPCAFALWPRSRDPSRYAWGNSSKSACRRPVCPELSASRLQYHANTMLSSPSTPKGCEVMVPTLFILLKTSNHPMTLALSPHDTRSLCVCVCVCVRACRALSCRRRRPL